MEGNYSYKDCDNSGSSNNTDNDQRYYQCQQ